VISGGSDCHGRPEADGRLPIEHLMVPDWVGPQFLARCEGLPGFL
jgi:hypothetical protein